MVYSALNMTVPTVDKVGKSQQGQETDLTFFGLTFLETGVIRRSCLAGDVGQQVAFLSLCWDWYQGQWRSRGYTEWDLNVRVVLVGPARCIRLTSRFLSFLSLSVSTALPTNSTHANTLTLAAPLQLTAWYPETWTLGRATQGKHEC